MAGGYGNREIAEALGTAEGTVENHTSSILSSSRRDYWHSTNSKG